MKIVVIRIGIIALLLTFIMQPWSLQLFYQLQQSRLREVMQKLITVRSDAETMILSKADFESSRIGKHEVLVNGRMYDIQSVVFRGNQVHLKVVADHQEDALKKKICRTTDSAGGKSGSRILSTVFQTSDFIQPALFSFIPIARVVIHPFLPGWNKLASRYSGVPVPPPRIF